MKDIKYTPAPWSYDKNSDQVEAFEQNGNRSLQIKIGCNQESKMPNAKLIAAAPKMLEALEDCLHILEWVDGQNSFDNVDSEETAKARKAIAEATGAS